jgi:hypothetical protein
MTKRPAVKSCDLPQANPSDLARHDELIKPLPNECRGPEPIEGSGRVCNFRLVPSLSPLVPGQVRPHLTQAIRFRGSPLRVPALPAPQAPDWHRAAGASSAGHPPAWPLELPVRCD